MHLLGAVLPRRVLAMRLRGHTPHTHTHTIAQSSRLQGFSVFVRLPGTADLCVIKRRRVSFFFLCAHLRSQIFPNLPPIENALELRVQSA